MLSGGVVKYDMPKQLSSGSVRHRGMFVGFSGHGNSINNIILQFKKENVPYKVDISLCLPSDEI